MRRPALPVCELSTPAMVLPPEWPLRRSRARLPHFMSGSLEIPAERSRMQSDCQEVHVQIHNLGDPIHLRRVNPLSPDGPPIHLPCEMTLTPGDHAIRTRLRIDDAVLRVDFEVLIECSMGGSRREWRISEVISLECQSTPSGKRPKLVKGFRSHGIVCCEKCGAVFRFSRTGCKSCDESERLHRRIKGRLQRQCPNHLPPKSGVRIRLGRLVGDKS